MRAFNLASNVGSWSSNSCCFTPKRHQKWSQKVWKQKFSWGGMSPRAAPPSVRALRALCDQSRAHWNPPSPFENPRSTTAQSCDGNKLTDIPRQEACIQATWTALWTKPQWARWARWAHKVFNKTEDVWESKWPLVGMEAFSLTMFKAWGHRYGSAMAISLLDTTHTNWYCSSQVAFSRPTNLVQRAQWSQHENIVTTG